MSPENAQLTAAYRHCKRIAAAHYENFPVASWLLPRRMRDPVAAIYAFARRADDLADEGQVSTQRRLSAIDDLQRDLLCAVERADSPDPVCLACADACRRHRLPVALLLDLLSAFRQDVMQTRYADDAELLDYCRRSANPVGRLLLHLCGRAHAPLLARSDALCTALQLLNFLQDLESDHTRRGRLYVPRTAVLACGLDPDTLFTDPPGAAFERLIGARLTQIDGLLGQSRDLARQLPGRLRWEIRATWLAARRVSAKLRRRGARIGNPCRIEASDRVALALQLFDPRA